MNGFYATQYLVERAYGNYLGLCRLGAFVAHELGVPLLRMTCFTCIAELDAKKADLATLVNVIGKSLVASAAAGGV